MGQPLLVSVVDDDESVRESLPDLLKEFGFAVKAFPSAEAFIASSDVDATRCLILDIAMPGMCGPELQKELVQRGYSIPIIFITAHGDAADRPRLIRPGRRGLPDEAVQRGGTAESAQRRAADVLIAPDADGEKADMPVPKHDFAGEIEAINADTPDRSCLSLMTMCQCVNRWSC